MHHTAMVNAERFFKTYMSQKIPGAKVVEIGSQNVNGSIREVCPDNVEYIGVDFVEGNGVDIVLDDPYKLPFEDGQIDFCLSSSVFEHSEMFWVLYLEVLRILKPEGLFYLNAPSNGGFHRHPVDCWRFYPDSGRALVNWAIRSGYNTALLESFVSRQDPRSWNDFVAVFLKDASHVTKYPNRITATIDDFYNGLIFGSDEFINLTRIPEDIARLNEIKKIVDGRSKIQWF